MITLGTKLCEAREKLNLSIEEVSERTKIRPHILRAIEEGDASGLQDVYMKSFIRTYAKFLKISDEDLSETISEAEKNARKAGLKKQKITKEKEQTPGAVYKELFKKKAISKKPHPNIMVYIFYGALGIAAFALVYLALFSNGNGNMQDDELDISEGNPDTTVIESKEESLLSYFDKPDSLILEARAKDTAWLRIDIDGKFSDQMLMYPGLEKRWASKEFFVLSLGNIGAIEFKRNGQLLQPFGPKGSVIRNLKITADKVESSSSPWEKQQSRRAEKIEKKSPPLIEPSKPMERPRIKKKNDSTP